MEEQKELIESLRNVLEKLKTLRNKIKEAPHDEPALTERQEREIHDLNEEYNKCMKDLQKYIKK